MWSHWNDPEFIDRLFNLLHLVGGLLIGIVVMVIMRKKAFWKRVIAVLVITLAAGILWELIADKWQLLTWLPMCTDTRGFSWRDAWRVLLGGIALVSLWKLIPFLTE